MDLFYYLLSRYSETDSEFWVMGDAKCFKKFTPPCGVLVEEFLCYCRFRCFFESKFLLLTISFLRCLFWFSLKIIINLLGSQHAECLCFVTKQKLTWQLMKKWGASGATPLKSAPDTLWMLTKMFTLAILMCSSMDWDRIHISSICLFIMQSLLKVPL